jgi:hypothetical protein
MPKRLGQNRFPAAPIPTFSEFVGMSCGGQLQTIMACEQNSISAQSAIVSGANTRLAIRRAFACNCKSKPLNWRALIYDLIT